MCPPGNGHVLAPSGPHPVWMHSGGPVPALEPFGEECTQGGTFSDCTRRSEGRGGCEAPETSTAPGVRGEPGPYLGASDWRADGRPAALARLVCRRGPDGSGNRHHLCAAG